MIELAAVRVVARAATRLTAMAAAQTAKQAAVRKAAATRSVQPSTAVFSRTEINAAF